MESMNKQNSDEELNSEGEVSAEEDNAPTTNDTAAVTRKPKKRHFQVECVMGDRSLEELRNTHPQRSTFNFTLGQSEITVTSDFDAGNMARCEQHAEDPCHFDVWMCTDSLPYYKYTGFRTWFYFAVKGVERGTTLHFHVRNLNHQRGLYAAGLKPFWRAGKEGRFRRVPGKVTWNNCPEGLQVNFDFQAVSKDPATPTYFSFVEPWGYEDTIKYFSRYQNSIKKS